jgi:hypothetical protein
MIRCLFSSSVLILISILTLATIDNAEGQEQGSATAIGTVADFCNFSEPINEGELAVNDTSNPTVLSSNLSGGTAAAIKLSSNGDVNLTVNKPEQIEIGSGTTKFSPSNLVATAINSFGLNINSNSTDISKNVFADDGVANMTINVNMEANNGGQKISAGKYKFIVKLTCTP